MILDCNNRVFVGKRIDTKLPAWQMPQGGIELGETPSAAAWREMEEEIGSRSGYIMAESQHWYSYDFPPFLIPRLGDGSFRGQKQKWFLIKFTGSDRDININTAKPEFKEWRWASLPELPKIITPFKRKLYKAVVTEFKLLI